MQGILKSQLQFNGRRTFGDVQYYVRMSLNTALPPTSKGPLCDYVNI